MTPAAVPAALSMRTDTEMLLGESLPCGTTMTVHRRCCSMPAPELMGPHQGLSSATRGHNCPRRSGHPRRAGTGSDSRLMECEGGTGLCNVVQITGLVAKRRLPSYWPVLAVNSARHLGRESAQTTR